MVNISLGEGYRLYNGVKYPSIDTVYTEEIRSQYPYVIILSYPNSQPVLYMCSSNSFITTQNLSIQAIQDVHVKFTTLKYYERPYGSEWDTIQDLGTISGGSILDSLLYDGHFKNYYFSFDIYDYENALSTNAGSVNSLSQMIYIDWDGDITGLEMYEFLGTKLYRVSNSFEFTRAHAIFSNYGKQNLASSDVNQQGLITVVGTYSTCAIIKDSGVYLARTSAYNYISGLALALTKMPLMAYFNPDSKSVYQGEDTPLYCYIKYIGGYEDELLSTDDFKAYYGSAESSFINFGGALMYVPSGTPAGNYTIVANPKINETEILGLQATMSVEVKEVEIDVDVYPTNLTLLQPPLVNRKIEVMAGSVATLIWQTEYSDGSVEYNSPVVVTGGTGFNLFTISNEGRTLIAPTPDETTDYNLIISPKYNGSAYTEIKKTFPIHVVVEDTPQFRNFKRESPAEGEVIKLKPGESVKLSYSIEQLTGNDYVEFGNIIVNFIGIYPSNPFTIDYGLNRLTVNTDASAGLYEVRVAPYNYNEPVNVSIIEIESNEDKVPTKFMLKNQAESVLRMTRGESRNLEFIIQNESGETLDASGFTVDLEPGISIAGLDSTSITLATSNTINPGNYSISVYPVVDDIPYSNLKLFITINVYVSSDFEIMLYNNRAEETRIDKTNFLTSLGSLSGKLRDSTSIISPIITIEMSDVPNFNYVLIPKFSRYYFVVDVVSIRNNIWEVSLVVDALMSFKNAILSCSAFIDRNEFESSPNIVDTKRVVEEGYKLNVVEIENSLFNPLTPMYALSGFYCFGYTNGG